MKLSNKIALITGGTSGIGLEAARLFQAEGATVVVMGTNADRLRHSADLRDPAQIEGHCRRLQKFRPHRRGLRERRRGPNGVALGRSSLVERDLAEGRLVRPFPQVQSCELAYYFIHRHESSQAAPVVAFKEWLLQQAGKTS